MTQPQYARLLSGRLPCVPCRRPWGIVAERLHAIACRALESATRSAPTALRPTGRPVETIEELTGRKVLAFLSQAHVEPDITMEIFFVDRPLDGFGALELVEPE